MKRLSLYLHVFFVVFSSHLLAQNTDQFVLSSAGGNSTAADYTVMWTIGEPIIETQMGSKKYLTQGFHQGQFTPSTYIFSRLDHTDDALFSCFPNPMVDHVRITWNFRENEALIFDLYNAVGQRVLRETAWSHAQYIDLNVSTLTGGIYIVQITSPARGFSESRQLIKIAQR